MMDCFERIVKLKVDDTYKKVYFVDIRRKINTHVIFALKVACLMDVGCEGYITFITEDK